MDILREKNTVIIKEDDLASTTSRLPFTFFSKRVRSNIQRQLANEARAALLDPQRGPLHLQLDCKGIVELDLSDLTFASVNEVERGSDWKGAPSVEFTGTGIARIGSVSNLRSLSNTGKGQVWVDSIIVKPSELSDDFPKLSGISVNTLTLHSNVKLHIAHRETRIREIRREGSKNGEHIVVLGPGSLFYQTNRNRVAIVPLGGGRAEMIHNIPILRVFSSLQQEIRNVGTRQGPPQQGPKQGPEPPGPKRRPPKKGPGR